MRYVEIKNRSDKDLKRLTGVKHQTFKQMVSVLVDEMPNFGRPRKLSRADQLLMTLMYWLEYRTQFHIAQAYGVSNTSVCRTIQKVEDALLNSEQFRLCQQIQQFTQTQSVPIGSSALFSYTSSNGRRKLEIEEFQSPYMSPLFYVNAPVS
jgi:hypothetical protein